MRFKFTNHAQYRIAERNIRISDVENAVRHPDAVIASGGNQHVARKKYRNKQLEVVYKEI